MGKRTAPEAWPRETRDLRLPRLDAQVQHHQARQGYGAALSHRHTATQETPGGQANPARAYALAHREARGMAHKGCHRALPVRWSPAPRGPALGLAGMHTPLLVSYLTTAQPAPSHDLAAAVSTRDPVASRPPYDASVSRATPTRYDPRQEPGAVVPHAGIWAGVRLASIYSPAVCDGGPDKAEPAGRYRVLRGVRSRARRSGDREHGGRNTSAWEKEPRKGSGVKSPTRYPLRGRPHHSRREGEAAAMLPGCVPTACVQGIVEEHGRAHGCKRGLQGRTS